MSQYRRMVLKATVATSLAIFPAQAISQTASTPLSSISEEQFLKAVTLIRPAPETKKQDDGSYSLTLPNGIPANAELQNCDDRKKAVNCKTVSIIVNLLGPEGKSRGDLLAIANGMNEKDIHGRTFVDDSNNIITRFAFFVTGHEPSASFAAKLINWDAFVRAAALSLYGNSEKK